MTDWWQGLPPVCGYLRCGHSIHELRWEAGELSATDHEDIDGEATLAALAGRPVECLDLMKMWERRRADPSILLTGSRGPGDSLAIDLEEVNHGHRAPLSRSQREVMRLLATGDSLAGRLQAETAAIWTRRLRSGHATLERTRPLLYAALYGRVLNALTLWRRDPQLPLELTMVDEDASRSISEADTGGLAVSLPFAWLSEVWARGLAVPFDRFCLSARSADGSHWSLETVAPDLNPSKPLSIELGT